MVKVISKTINGVKVSDIEEAIRRASTRRGAASIISRKHGVTFKQAYHILGLPYNDVYQSLGGKGEDK